jgi:nitrite reductase (NADH) small subunit
MVVLRDVNMSKMQLAPAQIDADVATSGTPLERDAGEWVRVAPSDVFPENGGACVKVGALQIAVFNFTRRGKWYACQNLCPHRMQMILSRGMLGSTSGVPKVACPYHKSTFSLETGACLNADLDSIETYPVRVEDGQVLIKLA